ncbi:hypothetical protein BC940DRAFT_301948 [Gongronella butleri]|nr:hypothetical protein BC940DRAFT_301948 [Gongronella butleri]
MHRALHHVCRQTRRIAPQQSRQLRAFPRVSGTTLTPTHGSRIFARSLSTTTTTTTTTTATATIDEKGPMPSSSTSQDPWHQKTSTIVTDDQSADSVWAEYTRRVNDDASSLSEYDFIVVARAVKAASSSAPPAQCIKRLQSLLRQLHQRDMGMGFVWCLNMLMHVYLENDDLAAAKLLFDGLGKSAYKPSHVTIHTLLDGITRLGSFKDARLLLQTLDAQQLMPPRADTWARFIRAYGTRFQRAEAAATTFAMALDDLAANNVDAIQCYNAMFDVYDKNQQMDRAWALYQQLLADTRTQPDKRTYTTLFSMIKRQQQQKHTAGGAGHSSTKDTKAMFDRLCKDLAESDVEMDTQHYLAMGWAPLRVLEHQLVNAQQPLDTHDYNLLLQESVRNNQFENALDIFGRMKSSAVKMDVYTYAIFMDAINKDVEQPADMVFELYTTMTKHDHLEPDAVIFNNLFLACGRQANADRAIAYLKEMEDRNIAPNLYIASSFLAALAQCDQPDYHDLVLARAFWQQLAMHDLRPDTRAYNNFLALLARHVKPKLYQSVEEDDDDQDNDGYASGSTSQQSAAATSMINDMVALYSQMRKARDARPDFLTYSILINTLAAQGQVRRSMQLYRNAQLASIKLNVSVYNHILQGLANNRDYHTLMNVWYDMKTHAIKPDRQTYDLLLDACQQLQMTETFLTIRHQRQQDTARLDQLDRDREDRRHRSQTIRGLDHQV